MENHIFADYIEANVLQWSPFQLSSPVQYKLVSCSYTGKAVRRLSDDSMAVGTGKSNPPRTRLADLERIPVQKSLSDTSQFFDKLARRVQPFRSIEPVLCCVNELQGKHVFGDSIDALFLILWFSQDRRPDVGAKQITMVGDEWFYSTIRSIRGFTEARWRSGRLSDRSTELHILFASSTCGLLQP